MIFGNWRLGGLAAGASLFGYTQAMQLRSGDAVARAPARRRHRARGVRDLADLRGASSPAESSRSPSRASCCLWYLSTDELPGQVTYVTPYVATLLVLSLASQRLRTPEADGLPYRRGEGH